MEFYLFLNYQKAWACANGLYSNAYNLLNRRYEYGLSEITDYTGIPLLAYSPLAFGHLTGKYLKNDNIQGSVLLFPEFGVRYDKPNVKLAVVEYNKLAKELGTSLTQISRLLLFKTVY